LTGATAEETKSLRRSENVQKYYAQVTDMTNKYSILGSNADTRAAAMGIVRANAGLIKDATAKNFILNAGTAEGALSAEGLNQIRSAFNINNASELYNQTVDVGGQKVNALVQKVFEGAVGQYKKNPANAQMDAINTELENLRARTVDAEKTGKPTRGTYTIDGKTTAGELSFLINDLERQKDRLLQGQTRPDTSQGSSIETTVHPPILNYWANKWIM
jgi:hypothetical protein